MAVNFHFDPTWSNSGMNIYNCTNFATRSGLLLGTFTTPFKNSTDLIPASLNLTWNLGVQAYQDGRFENQGDVYRNFYLGFDPDSSESFKAPIQACSIFFHGAYGGMDNETLPEMSNDCADDLTTRVKHASQNVTVKNDRQLYNFCGDLWYNMSQLHPSACKGYDLMWPLDDMNNAVAYTFRSKPSTSTTCHVNGTVDQTLYQADFYEYTGNVGNAGWESAIQASTSIITILFPPSGSNASEPEIHFTSLKLQENVWRTELPILSSASKVSLSSMVLLGWLLGVLVPIWGYSTL